MLTPVGFLKNLQIEQQEMGFSAPLGYAVCDECVADYAIRELILSEVSTCDCSFCGRSDPEPIAADTHDVLVFMSTGLRTEWSDAESELYYDNESDSGFAGPATYVEEILEDEGPVFANEKFEDFALRALGQTVWCPRGIYAVTPSEALRYGWGDLVETVKHKQRFFFLTSTRGIDDDDGAGARIRRGGELLDELGRLIREYQLVVDLPARHLLYRVRIHRVRQHFASAKALGAPPPRLASQSRMSPAGIPMFYAADEAQTALAETYDPRRTKRRGQTTATFRTREACRIVDLSCLPSVPSIFDPAPDTPQKRHHLHFLHGFLGDLRGEVEPGGAEHIDYVPTQVVCEYLRHVFRDADASSVSGLAWESVKRAGGRNVVLFIEADHCVELGEEPKPTVSPPVVELVHHEYSRSP